MIQNFRKITRSKIRETMTGTHSINVEIDQRKLLYFFYNIYHRSPRDVGQKQFLENFTLPKSKKQYGFIPDIQIMP